ncbi:hypothetical protein ONE63_001509 [Megalurothrips usitatus]|uniref:BRCT domain-containing protein n=1 Tax=Megalurothrips usitatus TaxID=439358 RepID=A0AAV7XCA5_9NEOP|nr:hypothetical protein ONE63_001509 [Megalurothrips usitatus]
MAQLASSSKAGGRVTPCRNKRKLMPLRSHNAGACSGPIVEDFDPQEKLMLSCPYEEKEPRKSRKVKSQTAVRKDIQVGKENRVPRAARTEPLGVTTRARRATEKKIVCTYMHRKDVEWVYNAAHKLGKCETENTVSAATTHVVCGEVKRTINFLYGIARGCWILTQDWIRESENAGHWLDEEQFEVMTFAAARQCRVARETLGVYNTIFNNGDSYYVARKTSPPYFELLKLMQLCGAKISSSAKRANVVVSSVAMNVLPGIVVVNEQWVLDSVVENMLQPKSKYFH